MAVRPLCDHQHPQARDDAVWRQLVGRDGVQRVAVGHHHSIEALQRLAQLGAQALQEGGRSEGVLEGPDTLIAAGILGVLAGVGAGAGAGR